MNSSDVKCYWSDGLVKNALFDNILYTIKFDLPLDCGQFCGIYGIQAKSNEKFSKCTIGVNRRLTSFYNNWVKRKGSCSNIIWNNIPLAFFNNLVRSMRRRCQVCINANGGHTRY
jgi:hypothetical protein